MTYVDLLPAVISLLANIAQNVKDGRGNEVVTDADWNELRRLANQSGEDIYSRLGIQPPPPKPEGEPQKLQPKRSQQVEA